MDNNGMGPVSNYSIVSGRILSKTALQIYYNALHDTKNRAKIKPVGERIKWQIVLT